MKKQNQCPYQGLHGTRRPSAGAKAFLLFFVLAFGFSRADAQPPRTMTMTGVYNGDVKGFCVETVTGAPDEVVMATTAYASGAPGVNEVMFERVLVGTFRGFVNGVRYVDNNNIDQRAVDLVPDGSGDYFITALSRVAGNDRIRIYWVTKTGALNDEIIIYSNGYNLYPLHSVFSGGYLYICGYTTTGNTTLPNEPGFSDQKEIFVLKYDPILRLTVNAIRYNTCENGGNSDDFDIAMRMTVTSGGNIHITGSVNNATPSPGGGGTQYSSATLNLLLDNMLTLPPLAENHFAWVDANGVSQGDEYGVGFVETTTGDPDNNFIVGNQFIRGGTPFSTGFNPFPQWFWVTNIDASYNWRTTPDSRFLFNNSGDGIWALQVLPSTSFATGANNDFIIAGMEFNELCSYGTPGYPSLDNVGPFLWDAGWFEVAGSINSPTSPGSGKWASYHNKVGTGKYGVDANSYWDLGGGLSNIAWNPTFASGSALAGDSIFMVVPKMRDTQRYKQPIPVIPHLLNAKIMRVIGDNSTNEEFEDPTCPGIGGFPGEPSVYFPEIGTNCPANPTLVEVRGTGCSPVRNYFLNELLTFNSSSMGVAPSPSQLFCDDSAGNYYKQANSVKPAIRKIGQTVIYPNPATNEVRIRIARDIADNARIELKLQNVFGQTVGILYDGNAAMADNASFPLSEYAGGIYTIGIYADGKLLQQEKLVVTR